MSLSSYSSQASDLRSANESPDEISEEEYVPEDEAVEDEEGATWLEGLEIEDEDPAGRADGDGKHLCFSMLWSENSVGPFKVHINALALFGGPLHAESAGNLPTAEMEAPQVPANAGQMEVEKTATDEARGKQRLYMTLR